MFSKSIAAEALLYASVNINSLKMELLEGNLDTGNKHSDSTTHLVLSPNLLLHTDRGYTHNMEPQLRRKHFAVYFTSGKP